MVLGDRAGDPNVLRGDDTLPTDAGCVARRANDAPMSLRVFRLASGTADGVVTRPEIGRDLSTASERVPAQPNALWPVSARPMASV